MIRSAIHRLYVRLGERLAPGRLFCRIGWHDADERFAYSADYERVELVTRCERYGCLRVLGRMDLGPSRPRHHAQISAVPSPADPPPSVEAPRAPAGGDTPGTFPGGGSK